MDEKWYCKIDNNPIGPIEASKVKKLAISGTLKETDFVRKESWKKWRQVRQLPQIAKLLRSKQKSVQPTARCPLCSEMQSSLPNLVNLRLERKTRIAGTFDAAKIQTETKIVEIPMCEKCGTTLDNYAKTTGLITAITVSCGIIAAIVLIATHGTAGPTLGGALALVAVGGLGPSMLAIILSLAINKPFCELYNISSDNYESPIRDQLANVDALVRDGFALPDEFILTGPLSIKVRLRQPQI